MGSQLLEGLRMRLTLIILFTTFGVTKAKQKPAAEPPMVKATEAVKVRSGSSGQDNYKPTNLLPQNTSRQALRKTCGVSLSQTLSNVTQLNYGSRKNNPVPWTKHTATVPRNALTPEHLPFKTDQITGKLEIT